MRKLYDSQTILNIIKNISKDKGYEFLGFVDGVYVNVRSKIKLKCKKDGYEWITIVDRFINNKSNCHRCNKHEKKSTDNLISIITNKCDDNNYTFKGFVSDSHLLSKTKLLIKCNKDNHEWTPFYDNFINKNTKCPKCSGSEPKKMCDIIDNINKMSLKNNHTIINIIGLNTNCKIHLKCENNHEWTPDYKNYIKKESKCRKCIGLYKLDIKDVIGNISNLCNQKNYTFNGFKNSEYKNAKSKLILICNKHNNTWEVSYNNFIHNHTGCPVCKSSKGELKIKEWLDNKGIEYIQQHRFPDCKNIKPLPFDFYLPEYNMCIEYDGEQHFNPFDRFGGIDYYNEIKNKDTIKNSYCDNNNIRLLRIPYNKSIPNELTNYLC